MDDLRRFVEIDDTKRALYMEARRTLKEEFNKYGSAFVCPELKSAVFSMAPESLYCSPVVSVSSDFNRMFPELIELFDGYMYLPYDRMPKQIWEEWFAVEMLEARIALIDFILSHS